MYFYRNQGTVLLISHDNSSLVIDKLCDAEEGTAVACFYFDFAARNEQSPTNMLGSLLRQLVSGLEKIPEAVVRDFRDEKRVIGGRGLQVPGILKMLQQTIAATRRTFICVDALDECVPEHRMIVLESLGQILQGSPNTRIFMTGRQHIRGEVEGKLSGVASFVFIQPADGGVTGFLRERLRKDTTPHIMSSTLKAEIMRCIPEISSETYVGTKPRATLSADIFECRFLLASLHIEAVLRETTIARRRKRLQSMKAGVGLGDAYGVTLNRIQAQGEEKAKLAMATLTWVCHSERPLEVDELCHALAVEIGAMDFDSENIPSIGTLLDCCQGLITVDNEASTVRLIHHTVQEYLCTHPDLFSKPQSIIAETCLTYLNSQQIKNLSSHPLPDYQSIPFLRYSSRYWGIHASRELSDHARTLALELLNQYEDHISAVSLLKQVVHPTHIGAIGPSPLFSGLHCASFFGIVKLVIELIKVGGCEINQQDCVGSTPLTWAAKNGHQEAVKLLLGRKDIDPNRPDYDNRTPLGFAAMKGHEGVAKLLLEREDVDPNRPDKNDQTPLAWATAWKHEGVVKLLLEREDVDPNRPNENNVTPLGWAAMKGHEILVKLLLERKDIDPNPQDKYDRTPLGWAAAKGHEGIVKLLLGREDVDPNCPDYDNRTPLGFAAKKGYEGVAKLLLERENVDPNYPDKNDQIPLAWATAWKHEGVAKLLLERENIDPNHPNENNVTPIGWAAMKGHEILVKLLLERKDIDPNPQDKYDRTPLGWAAAKGHEGIVKLLLGREDIDPNCPDYDNRTPLGFAALNGHEGVVKLLLERGNVDPNRPDESNRTPLSWAAANRHEKVVKLLLGWENVDPNRPDKNDRTPLGWAAVEGHEEVVKLLLEREDVDPNRPNEDGLTPLMCAAAEGHERVAKLLIERGNVYPNLPE